MDTVATPENDKVAALGDERRHIANFLEWLSDKGYVICTWNTPRESKRCEGVVRSYFFDLDNCKGTGIAQRTVYSDTDFSIREEDRPPRTIIIAAGDVCTMSNGEGYVEYDGAEQYLPDFKPIEKRLAEYFGIDLDKVEQERRAILEHLRSQ